MPTQWTPEDPESGVALFYALLVTLVVSGIVAVTFAAALTETRQAAFELDFEDALHAAEAGADLVLEEVAIDAAYSNASDPAVFSGDETEWAIEEALDPARTPMPVAGGEIVGLRPGGTTTQFVYGVSFVPSRAAYDAGSDTAYARVVRLEVGFVDSDTPGTYFLLSDDLLAWSGGGGAALYGVNGSVHSNGALDWPGIPTDGTVTCSGCPPDDPNKVTTTVPLNVGTPEEVYETEDAQDYVSGGGDWYDFCGGAWKLRTDALGTPCSGGPLGGNPPGFSGATMTGPGDGVYYFDGDIDVNRTAVDATMTVITGGDINNPGGNSRFDWEPAYPNLIAYAAGVVNWKNDDVNFGEYLANGGGQPKNLCDASAAVKVNAAAPYEPAIVFAGEKITFSGNPSAVNVAFITETVEVSGGGNGCGILEGDASGDLGGSGEPFVASWQELN